MNQREIKFRAFFPNSDEDILYKGMVTPLNPVWFEEYNYQHDDLAQCVRDNGGVLMQYTGLKDKNGVEIYEKDVCKVFVENSELLATVSFNEGCFVFETEKYMLTFDELNHRTTKTEVIGNIYENPDLLK